MPGEMKCHTNAAVSPAELTDLKNWSLGIEDTQLPKRFQSALIGGTTEPDTRKALAGVLRFLDLVTDDLDVPQAVNGIFVQRTHGVLHVWVVLTRPNFERELRLADIEGRVLAEYGLWDSLQFEVIPKEVADCMCEILRAACLYRGQ